MGLKVLAEALDQQILGGLLRTLLLLDQLPGVLRNVAAEHEAQEQADDEVVVSAQRGDRSPHVSHLLTTPLRQMYVDVDTDAGM